MSELHELIELDPEALAALPSDPVLEQWERAWLESVGELKPRTRLMAIFPDPRRAERECSMYAEPSEPEPGEEPTIWRTHKEEDGWHVTGLNLAALREVSDG